jgi:DNA-binding NarL/FixJ family response regulator
MSTRIVVVDDHLIVLDGLRRLIETQPDCHVVATCTSARSALEVVAAEPVDIVLLDLKMPEMSGLEFVRHVRPNHPELAVVILTADLSDEDLAEASRHGIKGIVLKEQAPVVLFDCIRVVIAGNSYFMDSSLNAAFVRIRERENERDRVLRLLTPREAEVSRLAALGLRSKEIGQTLGISPGTVKLHLHSIYNKLDIATRVELANLSRKLELGVDRHP